jgi:hypothetical protein
MTENNVEYQQGYCEGMRTMRQILIRYVVATPEEMWEHINAITKTESELLAELKEEWTQHLHLICECGSDCRLCAEEDE